MKSIDTLVEHIDSSMAEMYSKFEIYKALIRTVKLKIDEYHTDIASIIMKNLNTGYSSDRNVDYEVSDIETKLLLLKKYTYTRNILRAKIDEITGIIAERDNNGKKNM